MVKLDVQRSAQCANGNGLIEPAVLESQVVEEAKRLSGEPAQLVMVAFGLQFADDHQRHDHFVFGEPRTRPRVREQDGGVEHVRPGGRVQFGHRRSFRLAGLPNPMRTRPGHLEPTLPREASAPLRRAVSEPLRGDECLELRLVGQTPGGDALRHHLVRRGLIEDAGRGDGA